MMIILTGTNGQPICVRRKSIIFAVQFTFDNANVSKVVVKGTDQHLMVKESPEDIYRRLRAEEHSLVQ